MDITGFILSLPYKPLGMPKGASCFLVCAIVLCMAPVSFSQKPLTVKHNGPFFKMPPQTTQADYLPKTILFKIKTDLRGDCGNTFTTIPELNDYLKSIGAYNLAKKFPRVLPPTSEYDRYGRKYSDLSLIYEVKYKANVPLEKVINALYALGIVQYAQPHYIPHLCVVPNDTYYGSQYYISQIRADSAWNIETGDTNVVIGITDTGTELTHSDLKDNIKYNYADPINGKDDDGDGYIDNYQGWDLGENDNDPTWQGTAHGVHVCGIAAATTNNSNGIAGVGYKCKFLPVKIADHYGVLVAAYEGIQYAADHGCSVINCSWGGTQGGAYGQDVVTYATINKNALVVAAAGNDGANELFYPACYQYVLDVAATDNTDTKPGFSNYGHNISVCAPGVNIYSTWTGNTYTYLSGTSMASPCGAGAAAIVKSYFPSYNALQVAQRLIVTADSIDAINPSYRTMLGTGRINLYHALTAPATPSVVMTYDSIVDNNDNIFITNDTMRIRGIFTNYLSPATNLVATLSSTSPYVTITNSTANLGAVATMGTANNYTSPFTVKVTSPAPTNTTVTFELTYTDGSYIAHQYFNVLIDVDYLNITINDIATSITSKGLIGYDGPNQTGGGLGFTYKGSQSLFYECGLMVGDDSNHVSDYVRNTYANDTYFQSISNVREVQPPKVSQYDLDGLFNDTIAPSPLPVKVHHQAFAWNTPGNTRYVVVQYTLYNTGGSTINNMYAGLFTDWDVDPSTYNMNRSYYDASHKMGYARYYGSGKPFVGIASLNPTNPVINYSIDADSSGDGGVNIYYGVTTQQKYYLLSHSRDSAGYKEATGDDIVDVMSNGPFSVNAGDSIRVTFALIAGDSLQDLETSADSAYNKINGIPVITSVNTISNAGFSLEQNTPNPASSFTLINLQLPEKETVNLSVYNLLGEKITTIAHTKLIAGMHQFKINTSELAQGMYYYRLTCPSGTLTKKMMIIR